MSTHMQFFFSMEISQMKCVYSQLVHAAVVELHLCAN